MEDVHRDIARQRERALLDGVLDGLARKFEDPAKLLYDVHKGFWARHNKLTHDIV